MKPSETFINELIEAGRCSRENKCKVDKNYYVKIIWNKTK